MTNPFALSEIQGGAPQDAGNPYSLETIQGEARVDLRRSLLGAMDIDPDQAARTVRLSRQVGAPYEAVQANLRATLERGTGIMELLTVDGYERVVGTRAEVLAAIDRLLPVDTPSDTPICSVLPDNQQVIITPKS